MGAPTETVQGVQLVLRLRFAVAPTSVQVLRVSGLRYKFYPFDILVTDCKVALPFLGLG